MSDAICDHPDKSEIYRERFETRVFQFIDHGIHVVSVGYAHGPAAGAVHLPGEDFGGKARFFKGFRLGMGVFRPAEKSGL